MSETETEAKSGSSWGAKLIAVVILAVGAWVLLKVVIGLIAGLATVIIIGMALVAIIWAVRTLL